jgi:hypothetical protein
MILDIHWKAWVQEINRRINSIKVRFCLNVKLRLLPNITKSLNDPSNLNVTPQKLYDYPLLGVNSSFWPYFPMGPKMPIMVFFMNVPIGIWPHETHCCKINWWAIRSTSFNLFKRDLRFYVALDMEVGWVEIAKPMETIEVLVNYKNILIWCWFCCGSKNLIKNCPWLGGKRFS